MKKGKKREGKQEEERGKAETGCQTEGPVNFQGRPGLLGYTLPQNKNKELKTLDCVPSTGKVK